jgi:drug/metabolite transporter (DMT)-like permease
MNPAQSVVAGLALVGAGIALVVWGWRHHGTWLEDEKPPQEGHYSVHRPPSAPGIKRIVTGVVLVVAGAMLLARLVPT